MELRLFGGLRVVAEPGAGEVVSEVDLGGPRQRFVLALLALESNRVVAADRLIDLLWPDAPEKKSSSLQAYVSNLRKALQPFAAAGVELLRRPPGYMLTIERSAVDVLRFEDLVVAGRAHADSGSTGAALAAFTEAIDLWTAPPLPELADEPVVVHAATRWHNLLGVALEALAELRLDAGEAQAALLLVERRIEEFPLRERLHGLAALGLYRTGRQTEALRLIDRTRQSLVEASGLDIGDALADLERRILAQDSALQLADARTSPPRSAELTTAIPTANPGANPSANAENDVGKTVLDGPLLIGRDAELEVLRAAMVSASAGRGGVVTVHGQPGVGKSALVERFTDLAAAQGCVIAWTRAPQGATAPPFWPLVQIETQLRDLGALPSDAAVIGDDAQPDAFLFAQRLASAFRRADRTVVVVLDDLQWADDDTLRVLTYLVADLRRTRVLMIVTAHPLSPDSSEDLTACTGELARQRVADIGLGELGRSDVGDWLAARVGRTVAADVAVALFERTGGNPLYVREVVELMARGSAISGDDASLRATLATVPPGLVAVVRRRVGQLPGATQQALTAASVLGASGEIAVLADVVGVGVDTALASLSAAEDAGLMSIDVAESTFRFAHGIVAQALAAEVTSARRADFHAAAARSLARRHPDDEHGALVAHHAVAGAVAGTAALAIDAATRAARFAIARGAFVDAAQQWSLVATMLERFRPDDRAERLDTLIATASSYERADQMREAQRWVIAALHLAREHADPAVIERAVSVLNHASIYPNQAYGETNSTLITLLTSCLELLPERTSARATVLSAIATELFHSEDTERRDRLGGEALAIARELGEPALLARMLHAQTFALSNAETVPARRVAALELTELARAHSLGDDVRLMAEHQIVMADYSLGDLVASRTRLASYIAMLERPVNPALRSQIGFFRALMESNTGRYAESDAHFESALELFRKGRPDEADAYRMGRMLTVGHDLGGIPEELFDVARADEVGAYGLAWRLYTAVILFDLNRRDQARERIPYGRGEVPERPDDYTRTFIDTAAALIAVETRDVQGAELLLRRLLPMSGRWAAGGSAALSLGLVDLTLARLVDVLGDRDQAESLFTVAVAGHERVGAPAWLARSLLYQGRFWIDTDRVVDGLAALERAGAIAAAYGLAPIAAQVAAQIAQASQVTGGSRP